MAYVKYQPLEERNPLYNEDCLVRAVSKWKFDGQEMAWEKALRWVCMISYETKMFPPNITSAINEFFDNHGCKSEIMVGKATVATIAKQIHEPAFLIVKDHIVFCNNGRYFDSWNSGRKHVKQIIYLKGFKD